MVRAAENPSLRPPSCWRVEVVYGAFGRFVNGLESTLVTLIA